MKAIIRGQTSARPRSLVSKTIKKRKLKQRGGPLSVHNPKKSNEATTYIIKAHDNSQVRTALAKQTFRERSLLGAAHRKR